MPPTVKAVQLLVNESLPEDVRDYSRSYSKSSINELMTQIADKHPDNYAELVDTLKDLGRHASYYQGETLRLKDFKPLFDKAPIIDAMDKELAIAKSTIKDQKKLKKTTSDILGKYTIGLEKLTLDAAKNLKEDNNLYNAVVSGARGSNTQLKAIVTTPGTFTDLKGEIIPLFSRKSYGEGLSLGSFLASSYGLRQSTVTIKRGTATGGAAGKKFARAMTPFVVTRKQDLSDNGIDLPIDDDSLYGRVLARPAAGFQRGTVVDRDVLNTLKKSNLKHVIVHSPIATVSGEGISAEAFGYDYNKQLPSVGSHVGITVGQALGEPITQMALSSKHEAGMFKGKKSYSGLDVITQFTESPETFKDRAAVSEHDGKVESIKDAPQGGSYITVNGTEHYVHPNMEIYVKKGDTVEAGQIMSDGLADPEDITRLRGIGEGRRYVTDRLKQIFDDSGAKAHRRNVELFARAFVDHVRITDQDGMGDFLPDDIISYNLLEANYSPEEDSKVYNIDDKNVIGKYLQKPILHYTIGTKIRPSIIKHIKESGIDDTLLLSEREPRFEPVLTRLSETTTKPVTNDWLGKGVASYQKSNYIDSAIRGSRTNIKENINPYVRMSQPDFAEKIWETGKF